MCDLDVRLNKYLPDLAGQSEFRKEPVNFHTGCIFFDFASNKCVRPINCEGVEVIRNVVIVNPKEIACKHFVMRNKVAS